MFKLYSPSVIKSLCEKYQISPSKRLGQNFLIDKNILDKIVKSAELSKQDNVLEIGAGFGVLTCELAKKVKKVIAIEKDQKLCQILKYDILPGIKNVEIINQDILKYYLPTDLKKYKIVANLPYNISKPVMQKFISPQMKGDNRLVLLLQKEVAQKICSAPPEMNLLALAVQFYAQPQIISYVSRNSFWPKPSVDSAILKIWPYQNAETMQHPHFISDSDLFFQLAKAGFSHKRKKLVSNLSEWFNRGNVFNSIQISASSTSQQTILSNIEKIIASLGFKNTVRAQELGVGDWLKMAYYLHESKN